MDPRLNRVKPVSATGSGGESRSSVQDPRKQSIAESSDTGSGGSTPVPSRNLEQTPSRLSQHDATSLEKAFLNLSTTSGHSIIYRRKRDYLRVRSQTTAEELSRALQTAAQFPFIVEQVRQSQTKIDTDLERAEKTLRDSTTAEKTAAQDLVRLFFDILSQLNPKTISLETQLDTFKRDNQEVHDLQISATRRVDETNAKILAVATENDQLKTQFATLDDDVSRLRSQLTSDPAPWADSLETLRREHKEQISRLVAVTAENEQLKSQLVALKDDISQLRSQPTPDPFPWVDSLETLRRDHKEQISQLEDKIIHLQALPERLHQVRSEMAVQEENATKTARNFDSKLEDLGREVSKKGSQLAIKGLESQFSALRNAFKDTNQTHNPMSGQEENTTLQETRLMVQALKQEKDTQLEESHNIIMSDMQRIEHDTNEKIDKLQAQMDKFQDQMQALKELYGEPSPSPKVVTEQHEGPKALTLSQRMKEVVSQVDTLQAEFSNRENLLNDRLQSLESSKTKHAPSNPELVETQHGKALSALSQSIDIRLETHKNQIADLDRNLTTLMRAQMSSDDREALQTAKTLGRRMEKQEHQHQWLRTRFDNLTTESLHRQIIGYVAPILPKFEQGLRKMELNTENLEKRAAQASSQLEASISDLDNRIQLVEDNLAGFISKSQEQYDALARQFRETRDDVHSKLKDLHSSYEEQKTRVQQITERQAQHEKDRKQVESIQKSTDDSSVPRNTTSPVKALPRTRSRPGSSQWIKSPQPGSKQQKAAIGEWIGSDSSGDDFDLSNIDETSAKDFDSTALLNKFKKPINREASPRSSRAVTNSAKSSPGTAGQTAMEVASGRRKRKRNNISPTSDIEHVESDGDGDENTISLPRKRVHGK